MFGQRRDAHCKYRNFKPLNDDYNYSLRNLYHIHNSINNVFLAINSTIMKEYKIISKGFWKKDVHFEDTLNQYAREGWEVISTLSNGHGDFSKVIFERDKNKY